MLEHPFVCNTLLMMVLQMLGQSLMNGKFSSNLIVHLTYLMLNGGRSDLTRVLTRSILLSDFEVSLNSVQWFHRFPKTI